jgi:DNA-binding MarR family transcriptional regulator
VTKRVDVIDAGDLRKYRTEIPNSVDDMGLSVYAFRLYVHFKRVAGDGGQCYQGTRKLAEHCGMAIGMVVKAKRELEERGLIRITPGERNTNTPDTIVIVDIWRENFTRFSQSATRSRGEHPVHTVNTPVHPVNDPVHVVTHKKEPIKKEPIKNDDLVHDRLSQEWALPGKTQHEQHSALVQRYGFDNWLKGFEATKREARSNASYVEKAIISNMAHPAPVERTKSEHYITDPVTGEQRKVYA